ncbi:MAG TPA: pantetheine-phosphate adenylyltransferase [Flavobacteriales bacterium]|nr:pantetheine-phosphate adenylyltransferase [Flavobacteriales bacterium]
MKRAVFPGSFDPITHGHLNILERSATLFDEIIVAVGVNSSKRSMFPLKQRMAWLESVCARFPHVQIASFEGLTADFCRESDAHWLLRGVRNGGDFEYERTIAQMTKELHPSLETVILFTDPEFAHIHSNVVRDILKNGGDASAFVPDDVTFLDA